MKWFIALVIGLGLAGCGAVTEPYGLKDPFGIPKPFEGTERNSNLTQRITEIPDFLVGGIDGMEGAAEDVLREKVVAALQAKELGAATTLPSKGAWLLMGSVRERFVPKPVNAPAAAPPKKSVKKSTVTPILKPETENQSFDIDWTVQDGEGAVRAKFSTPFTNDVAVLAAAKLYSALKSDVEATVAARPDSEPLEDLPTGAKPAVAPHAAVVKIAGAPGDGERSLTRAIALMLANTGLTVSNTDDAKAWRVDAIVSVTKAGPKDDVVLTWRVLDAKGAILGEVEQKNQVSAGRLSRSWGEMAVLAAAAAAPSLAEVIAKAHNAGLDPQDAMKKEPSSPSAATKP
jgi:hypothetical protein